ncbi:MAG: FAD-dependent monooxygenase [Acetobacteraceae bacterium]|nr:FAD-dependent monooxygenase [Acetobacteraceae bacterium]
MRVSDVVIVGAGLSGTLAAVLLGRAGYGVTVVDRHREYPPEFRAEQLVGSQADALRRLGVFEALVAGVPRIDHAIAARRGRVIERVDVPHYGLSYQAMVGAARAASTLGRACGGTGLGRRDKPRPPARAPVRRRGHRVPGRRARDRAGQRALPQARHRAPRGARRPLARDRTRHRRGLRRHKRKVGARPLWRDDPRLYRLRQRVSTWIYAASKFVCL